jgi:hypothetical protein
MTENVHVSQQQAPRWTAPASATYWLQRVASDMRLRSLHAGCVGDQRFIKYARA